MKICVQAGGTRSDCCKPAKFVCGEPVRGPVLLVSHLQCRKRSSRRRNHIRPHEALHPDAEQHDSTPEPEIRSLQSRTGSGPRSPATGAGTPSTCATLTQIAGSEHPSHFNCAASPHFLPPLGGPSPSPTVDAMFLLPTSPPLGHQPSLDATNREAAPVSSDH